MARSRIIADHLLDRKQADLALKVLEKVGGYEGLLKKADSEISDDGGSFNNMIAEYYVLRTAVVRSIFFVVYSY